MVGESLFNDGVAIALYHLFVSYVEVDKSQSSVPELIIYFTKVLLLSPLLGAAFGVISIAMISVANRRMNEEDTTIQMAITICCAYLSFFVGEKTFEVSGVITCVVAGLVLSKYAPTLILHSHSIHSVWSTIEWIGNTLIFTLAGLIIGSRCIKHMELRDVTSIFLVYLLVMFSRVLMIGLCYPLFILLGKSVTLKEAIFITWGGLRGAVSMAISLTLSQSVINGQTTLNAIDAHRMFVLVGGCATLTLAVNAMLSSHILKCLGVT